MLFRNWLESIRRRLQCPPAQRSRQTCQPERRRLSFRPQLEILEDRTLFSATWVAQGPAPVLPTNGPIPAGVGAIQAIAADPGDANRVFAATVNGGIWETLNATAVSPTWTPLTDNQPTLAMGCIIFRPS